MKIGILETGVSSQYVIDTYGDGPTRMRAYFSAFPDFEFVPFPVYRTATVPNPREAEAWIIPGSVSSAYEDQDWIKALISFVQRSADFPIPLLGICFGHQLMSIAYGGKVERSTKGRGIGLHAYDVTAEGQKVFAGLSSFRLLAAHQDQVVVPPQGATLLATSPFCTYAALAYGTHALSLQPHPEFTVDYERHSILEWQKKDPIDEKLHAEALLSLEKNRPDGPKLVSSLAAFLRGQPLCL